MTTQKRSIYKILYLKTLDLHKSTVHSSEISEQQMQIDLRCNLCIVQVGLGLWATLAEIIII